MRCLYNGEVFCKYYEWDNIQLKCINCIEYEKYKRLSGDHEKKKWEEFFEKLPGIRKSLGID